MRLKWSTYGQMAAMFSSTSWGLPAWLAALTSLPRGVSAEDSSLNSAREFWVSAGQLPPASATTWKSVQEISTGSLRGGEHGYSQSKSTPSAPVESSHWMTDWMKAARVALVAAIADQ